MLTSENKLKEGRHVGLDFYDLLIEALIDPCNGGFECNGLCYNKPEAISCAIRSKIRIMLRIPKLRLVMGDLDLRVVMNQKRDSTAMAAPTASRNGWENPCLRTPRTRKTRPAAV
jgi:hypothetical protein